MQSHHQQTISTAVGNHLSQLANLNILAISLDADYIVQDVSNAAAKLYGVARQVMLGENYIDFCHKQQLDGSFIKNNCEELAANNDIKVDVRYQTNELSRQVEWVISNLYEQAGQHCGYLLLGMEVQSAQTADDNDMAVSLEEIIAHMPGNIYWMDKDCIYQGCNENVAKIVGSNSRYDVKGKTYEDFVAEGICTKAQADSFKRDDLWVMAHDKPKFNVEEPPMTDAAGNTIYYLTTRVPLHDKAGNVIGVVGNSIDITEQKRLEQAVKEKETLSISLEEIINHIPAPIYWMDKHCVYQGCNDSSAKLTGLQSRHDVKGKRYAELTEKAGWTEDQATTFLRDDQWVIKHNKPKLNIEEDPMIGPDGKLVHYLNNRVPLHDKAGNVVGVAGFAVDITDRKKLEQLAREQMIAKQKEQEAALAQSEQALEITSLQRNYFEDTSNILEEIINHVPCNIYWMDKNCIYQGCNNKVAEFLHLKSRHDVKGKTYKEFSKLAGWDQGQGDSFRSDDLRVMRNDKPILNVEEPPVPGPDSKPVYYLSSRVPLHDKAGNVVGVAGLSIDITDRKRAEQLEMDKQVMEETNRHLKTIAGSIAHELKNPLAGIKSKLNVVQIIIRKFISFYQEAVDAKIIEPEAGETPPEKIARFVKVANKRVDNADAYITMQLANMSSDRIDTDKFKECSINSVVAEALDNYSFADEQQQNLVHWQADEDFIFRGSERLTMHILWNLLNNAFHYIEVEHKGDITIWLEQDDQYNYLHFKDTAKGMPPEIAAHVFDQFFSKRHNGTGLGLAFCHMVMQAYGGDIFCTSEADKYAQFTLKFPRL